MLILKNETISISQAYLQIPYIVNATHILVYFSQGCPHKTVWLFQGGGLPGFSIILRVSTWKLLGKQYLAQSLFLRIATKLQVLVFQKQPPEVFCEKKMFVKISHNSQRSACARVFFLIKLEASDVQLY